MPSWGNACETIPFPYRHFERKREIFFRSRSSRRCEDGGIFVSQPSPQGEGAPKGRIGQKRYERERGRASQAGDLDERGSVSSRRFTAVPYPPLARSPFPDGEGKEEAAPPPKKEANPASLRSAAPSSGRGSRGYSLLPEEGGENAVSQTSHEGTVFHADSITKENGNGKRKRSLGCARDDETRKRLFPFLFNLLRKPTPPCCARQPLPREGASVDNSLLPMEGGAPKGRRLDGDSGISETKPSPRGEGGERSEPDRVLAV